MNSQMSPVISVILPVYNGGRHLAAAMHSLFDQTFRDFEIVAIDDGSRDHSADVLEDFAAEDERVRVFRRENRGFVATLNESLALSRGRYIARMDHDDLCMPQRFERQVERLEAEPDLVALGSRVTSMDPEGRILGLERLPVTHEEIEETHLGGSSAICHPAVMMRADAVRAVGGYREFAPVEDFDLWLRLGEIGRLANIEAPLLKYRRSTTGLVARLAGQRKAMLEEVMNDAWQRRGLPGQPKIPQQPPRSRADMYRQWAWMALDEGLAGTARVYAMKALIAAPLARCSWWLAMCAMLP
jgi:glycosyltransferase involved in cell wall biosynthesis